MSKAMYSTPIYQDYAHIHAAASSYVFVLEKEDEITLQRITAQINKTVLYHVLIAETLDQNNIELFQDLLIQHISRVKAGLHSVVVGSESFIWKIQKLLVQQGCLEQEYSLIKTESTDKDIYCVHCGHQQTTYASEYCTCAHCGIHLVVRTHFSQRLGAYIGICANVQQPTGVAS